MELEDRIKKLIAEKIKPAIQMDGGDIEYIGIEGNKVLVNLLGACSHCMGATMTLKFGVESMIKEEIDPNVIVELA